MENERMVLLEFVFEYPQLCLIMSNKLLFLLILLDFEVRLRDVEVHQHREPTSRRKRKNLSFSCLF